MNGQIYSFGDIEMVEAALNAVAMIFNAPMFSGGSLMILAGLIALIYTVMGTATTGKLNFTPFFMAMFIYFGGIAPKMTLDIEDYYSGGVRSVANVPIIMGLPASIAAEASFQLGEIIQTAMATPTSSKTFKEGGFADPLKIIYSLRTPKAALTSPYWNSSIESYVKDCARKSTGWNEKKAKDSPALENYLLNATEVPVTGMGLFFSTATGDTGVYMSCEAIRVALLAGTNMSSLDASFWSTDSLVKLIHWGTPDRQVGVTAASAMTDITSAYNDVTKGLLAGTQDAQQFMVKMLSMQAVENGIKCSDVTTDAEKADCYQKALIFSSMDQMRMDDAAGGSIFAKTAVPMMNIMLLFFYLFSPIILLVAMMMPAKSIQILSGYVLFAVWTQSWLPTAMVINFIIQSQATTAIANIAPNGIVDSNAFEFYNQISTKIGLASTLFAMTPILTMTLLSGSVMGLSQLGGAFNGRDRFDEKNVSPDAAKTGALASKGSLLDVGADISAGVDSNHNLVNSGTSGQAGPKVLEMAKAADNSIARDKTLSHENAVGASNELFRRLNEKLSEGDAEKRGVSFHKGLQRATGDTATHMRGLTSAIMEDSSISQSTGNKLDQYIAASLKAGTPAEAILGSGFSVEAASKMGVSFSEDEVAAIRKSYTKNESTNKQRAESLQKSWNVDNGVDFMNQIGRDMGDDAGAAFANKIEASDKYAESARLSQTLKDSVGSKASAGSNIVGNSLNQQGITTSAIKQAYLNSGSGTESDWNALMNQKSLAQPKTARMAGGETGMALEILGESNNADAQAAYVGLLAAGLGATYGTHVFSGNDSADAAVIKNAGNAALSAADEATKQSAAAAKAASQITGPSEVVDSTVDGVVAQIGAKTNETLPTFNAPWNPVSKDPLHFKGLGEPDSSIFGESPLSSYVPGGGSTELSVMPEERNNNMAAFGVNAGVALSYKHQDVPAKSVVFKDGAEDPAISRGMAGTVHVDSAGHGDITIPSQRQLREGDS